MVNANTLILWISTVILVTTSGLLVYSLLHVRRKPADLTEQNRNIDKSHPVLDVIWTLIPMAILALLMLLTYQALNSSDNSPPLVPPVQTVDK